MRVLSLVVGVSLCAVTALGEVRVEVRSDGSKVMVNSGSSAGGNSAGDLAWLASRHDRRTRYDEYIERYAEQHDVDPTLVRAVIQVESSFNPRAVSHKGARGLMQLMPDTAKRWGVTKIHDPEQNVRGGVRHLAYLLEMFGDLPRVLAAYNAGENAVLRHGGIPPYDETRKYVQRALTVYYGRPWGGTSGAITFAGKRDGRKLRGGFGSAAAPITATLIPGARYVGTR